MTKAGTQSVDEGTLLEDETQVTPDGQRVIEVYEVERENPADPGGEMLTVYETRPRGTTIGEQVEHLADEILASVVKTVTIANSGTVEASGDDESATLMITLSMAQPGELEAAPATAGVQTKSGTQSSTPAASSK